MAKFKRNQKFIFASIIFGVILILVIIFLSFFKIRQYQTNSQLKALPTPSNVVQEISWETASDLIKKCQIRVIFQAKTLQLNLRGHDNQLYYTIEPKFDDVVNLAKEVQGPCDIIQIVTE